MFVVNCGNDCSSAFSVCPKSPISSIKSRLGVKQRKEVIMNNVSESNVNGNGSTAQNPEPAGEPEKLFTQDDVNRIIGERLARVKTDVSPELQEKEQELAQKELYLDAREKLADAGLPKELLKAINCSSKEEMENSIKTIHSLWGRESLAPTQQKPVYRVSTGTSSNSNGSGNLLSGQNDPQFIRKAMGLKG